MANDMSRNQFLWKIASLSTLPFFYSGYAHPLQPGSGTLHRYVSPEGNDEHSGERGNPWKTIGHAALMVKPGTTVHVAPGHYHEDVINSVSGTASARIVFISDKKWGAKIYGQRDAGFIFHNKGDYVDIVGFEVSGKKSRLGIINYANHCRILYNHVFDIEANNAGNSGGAGIDNSNYDAADNDIIGNVVHDIGIGSTGHVQGIYHSNGKGCIFNNITYRNSGWGIHTWHNPKNLIISNNLVFENNNGGIVIGAGDAPFNGLADGFIVQNNILISNHKNFAITEMGDTGKNNIYRNNLFHNNSRGEYRLRNRLKPENTIIADPLLVNYKPDGTGDYRLRKGSPAINFGTVLDAPTLDIDKKKRRKRQGKIDIGPYSF